MELILASSSPRRKELLTLLNLPFRIEASHADETYDPSLQPHEIVMELARIKASVVAENNMDAITIGADTIVVFDDEILGKPKDANEARDMLTRLSGQKHKVYTGVALRRRDKTALFYEKTEVEFWPLQEKDIEQYLLTGEPYDKAGAYGIQKYGSLLVKSIKGDYFSVVGLPVSRLKRELDLF